jgi:type II secretory pathway predicted ATPase ExeA
MTPIDKRLARFGLSFHPFAAPVAPALCHLTPELTHVIGRCDHLIAHGGFALIVGDAGTGKSTLLRCLQARLAEHTDQVTGILTRPQASLADFYRELGALFGVSLAPHNRWAGARVLRERWHAHWGASRQRPVLIVDEAQEMNLTVLNELRLLCAAELDAVCLLSVILAGDVRLSEQLQERELLPLASRIRIHHRTQAASLGELEQLLDHLLRRAGNADLMTAGVRHSLAEHACGNRRSLMYLADQLLDAALADAECERIDEAFFARTMRPAATPASTAARARKAS